jgi:hypothetical protein
VRPRRSTDTHTSLQPPDSPAGFLESWRGHLGGAGAAIFGSIPRRKMPYRKFNLTVGELAPFLDCWSETAPGCLLDNFPGFAASRVKGQRESLLVLLARHLVCQITRANEHLGTPKRSTPAVATIRPSNQSTGNRDACFVPAFHWASSQWATSAVQSGRPPQQQP